MKKTLQVLSVIIFAALIYSCSAGLKQDAPPPPLKSASFDFVPPTEGITKSNDITFALLNPRYVESFREGNVDPYKIFADNMGKDFVEMLTARGYPYKGPFSNIDQMVYNEKKTTDLLIEPEIDLQFAGNYLKQKTGINLLSYGSSAVEYYADGDMTVSGKLNLIFSEPFTKTKIWVKSIQIDAVTFKLKSYYSYTTTNIPVNDPLVWNSIVDNLMVIYKNALSTAWNHLEPEELAQKKEEANEIKKNSGFLKN
ncbi:MAG: hypothetical protein WC644_08655 [Ignavibacteria bacterium]